MKTQYLYFETHQYADGDIGFGDNPKTIENVNFLLLKQSYFNSDGVYQFTHATNRRNNRVLWVNQYWIDLDVFDLKNKNNFLVYEVKDALQKVKKIDKT